MNFQKRPCKHSKAEEQYMCLEAQCLSKKEFKLDCLRCLMQNHPHTDSITHIQDIIIEAQKSQQQVNEFIEQNLKFCQNQKQVIENEVQEKRNKINYWLDLQKKIYLQDIDQYENELKHQRQKIIAIQLTQENLQDLKYEKNNETLKEALESNRNSFNQYFSNQFERMSKNYLLKKINLEELPKFEENYQVHRAINYEKCTSQGCSGIEKSKFCLEKTCLVMKQLALECPQCLTSKHWTEQKFESHNKEFVSATELWDLQNSYIDEVEKFCNVKESEIKATSQELQQYIIEFQKLNEQKLQQFMVFIIEKEKQILQSLSNFKSQYQKEKFVIYQDLLLQTDFSNLADIVELEFNFKNISEQFKNNYQNEQTYDQQQFQELWSKGSCLIQKENILLQSEIIQNPISKIIQDLEIQIVNLQSENKQSDIKIKMLQKQNDSKFLEFDKILMSLIKDNGKLDETHRFYKRIIEQKLIVLTNSLGEAESKVILDSINQLTHYITERRSSERVPFTPEFLQMVNHLMRKLEQVISQVQDLAGVMPDFQRQGQLQNI